MQQLTLAHQSGFQRCGKKTRREHFLDEMETVMPWVELLALVAPYRSKGETRRKPVGLEIMLRVYFVQQWFALSDPDVEDALIPCPRGEIPVTSSRYSAIFRGSFSLPSAFWHSGAAPQMADDARSAGALHRHSRQRGGMRSRRGAGCNMAGSSGTTAGTYTVIVTGTSGATTATGTVTLTIQ